MLQRFLDSLQALQVVDKKILMAVSGGLDSCVLLDLFVKSGYSVAVAHANFQLRGEDAMADETWVGQLATKWRVPFFSRRFSTNNYATENGLSIQMAARELRYAWFDELLTQEQYDFLATAHHVNDNIETVILNFARGAGLGGLKGMPVKNGRIIRPLLAFSQIELEEYATSNKLVWREDVSNATDDYSRNFVRHQIVPKLRELNPSIEETFVRNCERLEGSLELMNWALNRLTESYVSKQGGQLKILKTILDKFLHPSPVLLELIKVYGFNLDQCGEMVLASEGQPGKQFFSKTHQLTIDREALIISLHLVEWTEVQIQKGQSRAEMGPLVLEIASTPQGELRSTNGQATLDLNRLQFPLLWRKWKPGDYFFPLGMEHKKKLSDFLIDNKVPLSDKDNVTVIESEGEIVWVVGYRIDNRFRVLDSTKSFLTLSLNSRH